jgi:Tfp pilus assembly protein PilV
MDIQVKEETGFSAIEMLLCIIIVLMVGFIGYYVYHTQKSANATYNSASKIAAVSAPKVTKKAVINSAASQQDLTIKEWGIKVKISSDSQPYYTYLAKGQVDAKDNVAVSQDTVYVYSTKFDDLKNSDGNQCKAVDDNEEDPASYSNPPALRRFLVINRYLSSAIPDDADQYEVTPAIAVGSYTYIVSSASHYAPGCSELWRGSVAASLTDNSILNADQSILTNLTSDFKTITAAQ